MTDKGLVRPISEYAGPVLGSQRGKNLQNEFKNVQNRTIRSVTGNYNFENGSMTNILKLLK